MEKTAFTDFFIASTGASAALIGLLFVAIAVEPRSIVGEESPAESRAVASSAFTAFANVFFVSLAGTWPTSTGVVGYVGIAVAVGLGLSNTLGAGLNLWQELEDKRRFPSRVSLVAGSFIVYALEIWFSYRLTGEPASEDYLSALAALMMFMYGIGLGRAWELLGARDQGFLHSLFALRGRGSGAAPPGQPEHKRDYEE